MCYGQGVLTLQQQFGSIDIYLFDQVLKGNILPDMRILDAGSGQGRNLVYFLRQGHEVFAADADAERMDHLRSLAAQLAPRLPATNFRVEPVEAMSFDDDSVDCLLSSAVLHFARDDAHFDAMLQGGWRKLKPGGLFFCRLASSIGLERQVVRIAAGQYKLPDGSQRYLVDEAKLESLTRRMGRLVEPIKTTIVQNQRAMTTWVVRKNPPIT